MKAGIALLLLFLSTFCIAQDDKRLREIQSLQWKFGPTSSPVSGVAHVNVPKGYAFLDAANTSRFLELLGNPPRADHFTLAPKSLSWFVVFHFDSTGYVKDDEKIDADALLNSLKQSDTGANEERRKLGMPALYTVGWQVPPHYDATTKRLEWGVQLRTEAGEPVANYTSRILGRNGVMSATLVSDPQSLPNDIQSSRLALTTFGFNPGQDYTEFRNGDKVAEYGLSALIIGGAAAVAAKSGFLKTIGQFIWVAIVGLFAAISAFFKKVFGRRKEGGR